MDIPGLLHPKATPQAVLAYMGHVYKITGDAEGRDRELFQNDTILMHNFEPPFDIKTNSSSPAQPTDAKNLDDLNDPDALVLVRGSQELFTSLVKIRSWFLHD